MPEIVVFVISLAAAIRGADWLGRAAVGFAKKHGISEVVVGATIVSVATTLPELAFATVSSAWNNDPLPAIGVTLGSPIINLGLILGFFLLVSQTRPKVGYFSRSVNLLLVLSLLLLVISLNQPIGGFLSFLLIVLGCLYLLLEFLISKKTEPLADRLKSRFESFFGLFHFAADKAIYFELVLGAVFLAVGSKFLVDSVVSIASSFHINEILISLSIVAFGTAIPELITAINSLIYKREGLSIGNLVGASVIDLTIGVGLGTFLTPVTLSYPSNLFIFGALLVIGGLSLLSLWKRIPVKLIGGLLIAILLGFFVIFTFTSAL